jgi:hypothetical protein
MTYLVGIGVATAEKEEVKEGHYLEGPARSVIS